jgi:hypothetical protein
MYSIERGETEAVDSDMRLNTLDEVGRRARMERKLPMKWLLLRRRLFKAFARSKSRARIAIKKMLS